MTLGNKLTEILKIKEIERLEKEEANRKIKEQMQLEKQEKDARFISSIKNQIVHLIDNGEIQKIEIDEIEISFIRDTKESGAWYELCEWAKSEGLDIRTHFDYTNFEGCQIWYGTIEAVPIN